MTDTTETVVTTTSDEPEDPSILAEAAVAAAALSGAAAVRASDANDTADEAQSQAQGAERLAGAAIAEASTKTSEEDARRIAREEAVAVLMELERQKKLEETPVETPEDDVGVDPQILPPSVAKANSSGKKHRFADWYHGDEE